MVLDSIRDKRIKDDRDLNQGVSYSQTLEKFRIRLADCQPTVSTPGLYQTSSQRLDWDLLPKHPPVYRLPPHLQQIV